MHSVVAETSSKDEIHHNNSSRLGTSIRATVSNTHLFAISGRNKYFLALIGMALHHCLNSNVQYMCTSLTVILFHLNRFLVPDCSIHFTQPAWDCVAQSRLMSNEISHMHHIIL